MTHPGELLKKNNLYAGKEMGQNFLSNPASAQMIVDRTGIGADDLVLEIGPGLGALTLPLAKAAAQVVAVEKDRRLIPLLEDELEQASVSNVTIINKNILKTDILKIAGDRSLVVMGNLPYNISSQILFKLVKTRSVIDRAFLMFQKELGARILASPGSRAYSRLSAVVQYAAKLSHVADIRPSSFFPRPEVDSSVLGFHFFETPEMSPEKEDLLFAVIKDAFSKRRKTLKNSLSGGGLGFEKQEAGKALDLAGIDPVRRAETLTIDEFILLAKAVWAMGKHGP
ncbi:MAG: ribosomal RNA small subunit methyltransferase A [Desulfobacter sp.]|nr:MAG: ribosomal RNA small subunit methyltransferase A [Desulfobacter sp.]